MCCEGFSKNILAIDTNQKEGVQAQEHRTLSGRCAKRLQKPSKSGMLIPDEFLQPYRAHIVKDTVGEVMKILQQALPSDMLARITPSIIDPSNNLLNKQSYQCQVITNNYNFYDFHYIFKCLSTFIQLMILLLFLERWSK